jgi:carboxypeptidase C (cathepsin A)
MQHLLREVLHFYLERGHLPIPVNLESNISYHFYQAGHMVYTSESVLRELHENVASFIESTFVSK